jgi:hypothetical protein
VTGRIYDGDCDEVAALLVAPWIGGAIERSQTAVGETGSVLEHALWALPTVKANGPSMSSPPSTRRPAWRGGAAWRRSLLHPPATCWSDRGSRFWMTAPRSGSPMSCGAPSVSVTGTGDPL